MGNALIGSCDKKQNSRLYLLGHNVEENSFYQLNLKAMI